MLTNDSSSKSVAIIGAGLSGLTCAQSLSDLGMQVTVFDKGRRPGGRMSTRQSDGRFVFDHGCKYFSATHPQFQHQVQNWLDAGIVAEWQGDVVELINGISKPIISQRPRYVGSPEMASICQYLAETLDVNTATEISNVRYDDGRWKLSSQFGVDSKSFQTLVMAFPVRQAEQLVGHLSSVFESATAVEMAPCWTLMAVFEERVPFTAAAAVVHDSPLSWVARNNDKPNRESLPDSWVLQANADWSAEHLDASREAVSELLWAAFQKAIGCAVDRPIYQTAHRWRYALPSTPLSAGFLSDACQRLFVCGDWCLGNRVESAFLSGLATAERICELPD